MNCCINVFFMGSLIWLFTWEGFFVESLFFITHCVNCIKSPQNFITVEKMSEFVFRIKTISTVW